jgi:hypothetical protein
MDSKEAQQSDGRPFLKRNIFQFITGSWLDRIFVRGYREPLQMPHLPRLEDDLLPGKRNEYFREYWAEEKRCTGLNLPRPRICEYIAKKSRIDL